MTELATRPSDRSHQPIQTTSIQAAAMDLSKFLVFVFDGAFTVFEQIVLDLSSSDLKSLRLVIRSLSDPLFPYMFSRLFLSLDESDLSVFNRLINDPRVCRNITDICWDDAFYDSNTGENFSADTDLSQLLSRGSGQIETFKNLATLPPTRDYRLHLHGAPIPHFWKAHDEHVKDNQKIFEASVDSVALRASLPKLPNLRQLDMFMPSRPTSFDPRNLQKIWDSPRVRNWQVSALTDFSFLPGPASLLPRIEPVRGFRSLLHLCKEAISVDSIDVQFINPSRQSVTSSSSLCGAKDSPNRSRSSISTANAVNSLKVRFLVEVPPGSSSSTASVMWLLNFDRLLSTCQETLRNMTIYRVGLDSFLSHFLEYQHYNEIHPLASCAALRKIQLSTTSCECMFALLCWISKNTRIQEIELSEVHSIGESWHSVMTRMKQQGIVFDAFEMVACRSRSHQRTFGPSISAPWYGTSNKIAAWLKKESDDFPLWQGDD